MSFEEKVLTKVNVSRPNPSQPSLLTVEEVALYLRVTPTTVRKMAGSGQLPAFKVGRSWRFHRSDIDQLANQRNP